MTDGQKDRQADRESWHRKRTQTELTVTHHYYVTGDLEALLFDVDFRLPRLYSRAPKSLGQWVPVSLARILSVSQLEA